MHGASGEASRRTPGPGAPGQGGRGLRCDFCGEEVTSVRRVALDQGYDRLQAPHRELYACSPCSEKKEQIRRGLGR
jgi:hypothetical protein